GGVGAPCGPTICGYSATPPGPQRCARNGLHCACTFYTHTHAHINPWTGFASASSSRLGMKEFCRTSNSTGQVPASQVGQSLHYGKVWGSAASERRAEPGCGVLGK